MSDWLNEWRNANEDERLEWINAYIDNEMSESERTQFEAEMARDAALQADVDVLRQLKVDLSTLPEVDVPRNFLLNPLDFVEKPTPRLVVAPAPRWSWLRLASVLGLLVAVFAVGAFLADGFLGGVAEPQIIEKEVIVTQIVEVIKEVEGETVVVTELVEVEKEVILEVEVEQEVEAEFSELTEEAEQDEMMEEETAAETSDEEAADGGAVAGRASSDEGDVMMSADDFSTFAEFLAANEGAFADYRIGLPADPETVNPWRAYSAQGNSYAKAVLDGTAAQMYTLGPQRFDFVPKFAADMAEPPVQREDGTYTIDVVLLDGPTWSDEVPITAGDVAFTLTTCRALQLDGDWADHCQHDALERVEAMDALTVRYTFNQLPNVGIWQYGVAQAPILPEHVWLELANAATAQVAGLDLPDECGEEDEVCGLFDVAREGLFSAEILPHPSAGGYITTEYQPGAFVRRTRNDNYFFGGTNYTLNADGQYRETWFDGTTRAYYGNGSGDQILTFTGGPYSPQIIFKIFDEWDDFIEALRNTEIDYFLGPWQIDEDDQRTISPSYQEIKNPQSGFFYLAFNLRQELFSDLAFRQAVSILIDREQIIEDHLDNEVLVADRMIWTPDNVDDVIWETYDELSAEKRFDLAVQTLETTGYSWETKPEFDTDTEPRQISLPSGDSYKHSILILNSSDPQTEIFGEIISSKIGMLHFDGWTDNVYPYLRFIFEDPNFTMYILGWDLEKNWNANVDFLCVAFDSRNDVLKTDLPASERQTHFNSTGYSNPQFDALCDDLTQTTSLEENTKLLNEMQAIIARDLPYIPLFSRQQIDYVSQNVVFPYTEVVDGIYGEFGMQTHVIVLP